MRPFSSAKKYLLLLPLFVLVFNAVFFMHATREIEGAMIREKYTEITHSIDMLAAAVEANPSRIWLDHERNIVSSVEYLDRLHQVYAAAYKTVDGGLVLVTERFYANRAF